MCVRLLIQKSRTTFNMNGSKLNVGKSLKLMIFGLVMVAIKKYTSKTGKLLSNFFSHLHFNEMMRLDWSKWKTTHSAVVSGNLHKDALKFQF